MTEENPNQEEEAEAIPAQGGESEEATDLENLFANEETPGENPDDKIARLEKTVSDLKKGVAKAFSQQGRQPKEAKEVKTEGNSVIKNLYFKANPEAELEWDNVEKTAKELGKDPFELYESSAFLKGEAKAKFEAKIEEEKNKSKIAKPSSQPGSSQIDISKTKPEEVDKLTPAQKVEWVKAQAQKEREQID